MIHPASRLEVAIHSRADGRNAVKSAAYTARASYRDTLGGFSFRPSKKGGLLSHELINWSGTSEELWNAAEAAENRGNSRVIREIRPSLPHELSIDQQIRLVRGFSLWLRDEYGVAIQANIHAPRFKKRSAEKLHQRGVFASNPERYETLLFDPKKTNLNFHAHILMTTREVDGKTGAFGKKTRTLDDRSTGPGEILKMRQEWEKRTNSALEKAGSENRIDMRSYREMAKAGDAPEGLKAQEHLGPRRAERSRRMEEKGLDRSLAGYKRKHAQKRNQALWTTWLNLRALEREKLREEESARIAELREAERKQEEKRKKQQERTPPNTEVWMRSDLPEQCGFGAHWAAAIRHAMQSDSEAQDSTPNEFDVEINLEASDPTRGSPTKEEQRKRRRPKNVQELGR